MWTIQHLTSVSLSEVNLSNPVAASPIAKIPGSISVRYRSEAAASYLYLSDIEPSDFAVRILALAYAGCFLSPLK